MKEKGATGRFNAPWALTDKTRIVYSDKNIDETMVKQSGKLIDKVLSYIITVSDLSDVTLSEILEERGVAPEQYGNALGYVGKKISILYKKV